MRRKPQQQRSRVMVQTILEAGFVTLAKRGLEGTTTVHIADTAGISVGTLYQYFANKEDVFEAMNHHFVAEIMQMLRELAPEVIHRTVRDVVELMLYRFSDLLRRDDERYLKCIRHGAWGDVVRHTQRVEAALMDIVMQYVMHNPDLLRMPSLRTVSYIIINGGVFSVVHHLSSPRPDLSFEQLVDGLAHMADSYVQAELARAPTSS